MPKLTKTRWIWIVLADGGPLKKWPHFKSFYYSHSHATGFGTRKEANKAKLAKLDECVDMMERVKHDAACVARWQATYDSVQVIRIKLPEGVL